MSNERPVWRRILAIVALVGAGTMAWYTAQHRDRQIEVSWILTHVELNAGNASIGRDRLVGVMWSVPQAGGTGWTSRGTAQFAAGTAPEVSGPHKLRIPAGMDRANVACTYALAGGTSVQTRTTVALQGDNSDRWTIDIGTCGPLSTAPAR